MAEDIAKKPLDEELEAPADFTSPEELYQELIRSIRKYHPSDDISMVEKAYEIAYNAHKEQKRKSGEPYIIHPLCVAIILADLELDKETIVAGILHDVVEDTVMTDKELAEVFGDEVALLVDGVTKLTQISWSTDKVEIQAENLRKMFLAMAKDIRVILIKLADRLHNMRTLQYMTPAKQKEKARETMDIYAPIADRLGISKIKTELDDLSLKYLEPEVYYDLAEKISLRRDARNAFVQGIVTEVKKHMEDAEIEAKVDGRVKHFFSIYKKMVNQDKTLDQIYDLFAVRIIVETVKDCYAALGVIHEMYKPIPGRFKDYIAMPKPNMYQSLHTTLIGSSGQPFEIQIRTYEMHRTAEYGIAAHWKYKESGSGQAAADSEEAKLSWLRQILEWQKDMSDNKEFLSLLKSDLDLFSDSVYCFTPSGDVKNLPSGSTPIDFAYSIHSAVGNKMVGASVNGKLVNIDYVIQNGDQHRDHHLTELQGPQPRLADPGEEHAGEEQDQPVVQDRVKGRQHHPRQGDDREILQGQGNQLCRDQQAGIHGKSHEALRVQGLGFRACLHRTRRPQGRPGHQQDGGGAEQKAQEGSDRRQHFGGGRRARQGAPGGGCQVGKRHCGQGDPRPGRAFFPVLQSGARGRDRGLCHQRPRYFHPQDRLHQHHKPPGDRTRPPDRCGVAAAGGRGEQGALLHGDQDLRQQPDRNVCGHFQGVYRAADRHQVHECAHQQAGQGDHRHDLRYSRRGGA